MRKFALAIGFAATAAVSFAAAKNISLEEIGAAVREARKPTPSTQEIFDLRVKCHALGEKMLQDSGDYQFAQRADEDFFKWLETAGPDLKKQPNGPQPQRAYWNVEAATNYDPVNSHCYVKIELNTADLSAKPYRTHSYLHDGVTKELLASVQTEGMAWEQGRNVGHIFDNNVESDTRSNFQAVVDYINKHMTAKR